MVNALIPVRVKCRELRRQGLSYGEIIKRLGVNRSTLSYWLRDVPISKKTKKALANRGAQAAKVKLTKPRGEESAAHKVAPDNLTRQQKAKIAESAVLFRACLHGFHVFGSMFDGDRADWVILVEDTPLKIQVKWAKDVGKGLPRISLMRYEGNRKTVRYKKGDFDFIVGYDLFTDTAYVYSWADVARNKTTVSISENAAERWDKLRA